MALHITASTIKFATYYCYDTHLQREVQRIVPNFLPLSCHKLIRSKVKSDLPLLNTTILEQHKLLSFRLEEKHIEYYFRRTKKGNFLVS